MSELYYHQNADPSNVSHGTMDESDSYLSPFARYSSRDIIIKVISPDNIFGTRHVQVEQHLQGNWLIN